MDNDAGWTKQNQIENVPFTWFCMNDLISTNGDCFLPWVKPTWLVNQPDIRQVQFSRV